MICRRISRSGYQIISSGGTHAVLQAAGIPVMKVSEYTGSPEILNGKSKDITSKDSWWHPCSTW